MKPMADNQSSESVELGKQTLHVTTVISVVIPMFNAEKTILPAIKSVLKQTFIDYEIIVVDDCSTDRSWNQVQALQDPRIRPFRAARNSGAAAARNLGMRHAQGEWIVFLDADDQWDPRHLAARGVSSDFPARRRPGGERRFCRPDFATADIRSF